MNTKHYITEQHGFIINGFSDAFQQPVETDICINEDGGRHFQINGATNPQIKDDEGFSLYKYINGEISTATQEEQPQYAEVQVNKLRAKRNQLWTNIDKYQGVLMYAELTPEQQIELSEYRQLLKDVPISGVLPEQLAWML